MIKIIIFIICFLLIFNIGIEKMENLFYLNSNINSQCCLVKKLVDSNGFYYHYKKTKCDNNMEKYLNSERLLNEKQFPIKMCNYYESKDNNFKQKLGSCRDFYFTCIDFVNKKTCDRYGMRWADVPCNMPLIYKNKVKEYKISIENK